MLTPWTSRVIAIGLLWLMGVTCAVAEALSYTRDVRPILSKNCFACHGPDEETVEGDTRLDVAGEADLKAVVARITATDPDDIMPPPESNKSLEPEEVAILKQWVKEGAPYEQHWAFVHPKKAPVPEGVHPIDHFIDRRLAEEGLERSPQADPHQLIRRVYLDLIGLPPGPAEADAFAADPSPEAYAEVVDRLLASPRYGERWARKWLDLARYADTNGYEKDRDRSIWPYRDWVIRALNEDKPFDQFTVEQIAGDMLPDPTVDQLVATGFHRNTMLNEEGGIDPLEFRYHAMADRVGTTGTTWLGLTTSCAQCHTHKYDPITHRDYFGMMAYLDNAEEPDFHLPVPDAEEREAKNRAEADQLLAKLPSHWPEPKKDGDLTLEEAEAEWIAQQRAARAEWRTLTPEAMEANIPYLVLEEGGMVFAGGDTSKHDIYTLDFGKQDQPVTAIRLEALPDPRLPGGGAGMTYYEGRKGEFFLGEFTVNDEVGATRKLASASESGWGNTFGSRKATASDAIDGDIQSGWSNSGYTGERLVAVFNLAEPLPAGTGFSIRMDFGRHFASSLGKFRLSVAQADGPLTATGVAEGVLNLLDREDEAARAMVRETFLMDAPQLKKHADRIRSLREPVKGTPTLIMKERPAEYPRATFLRHRGEYTQPKELVEPRLPDALWPAGKPYPEDRLGFARWLVSRENPLTARVVVNRHWAAFFGTGIVKTVDDFGMQGELPSHPALLDYLAVEFMDLGWSLKSLHRLIVTSGTYQQDSVVRGSAHTVRLLDRFPRRRLEAEIIRDAALGASGLLEEKMFGPPVRPPQPAAAAKAANYGKSAWKASEGADRFRRSLYTYQQRTAPFAMFTTFDAGSGEACIAKRDASNSPLQALTLLNDPMFVEIAEAFGKELEAMEGDTDAKLRAAFRRVLTREPDAGEMELLRAFHAEHDDWMAVARALLSLDEAITKN